MLFCCSALKYNFMKKRHINIPVFIPHLGCPNNCTFCNQRTISGVHEFVPESVIPIIEEALSTISSDDTAEIAFFGGSFTGIERSLMEQLLDIASSYIKSGAVSSIRCSTRPDYINDEVLEILKRYGVSTIELGLQSISERVLLTCKRGHTFEDERAACKKIKDYGFKLCGQMMIGLPSSTLEDEIKTAEFIVSAGAEEARIYPTIVFRDTELCNSVLNNEYEPLTLEDAINRASRIFKIFVNAGVKVLRIGLCDSENLHSDETYFAGPNHVAIGELVKSQIYLEKIIEKTKDVTVTAADVLKIYVAKNCLSKAIGQKKNNKFLLTQTLKTENIVFYETDKLSEYEVSVVVEGKNKKCT